MDAKAQKKKELSKFRIIIIVLSIIAFLVTITAIVLWATSKKVLKSSIDKEPVFSGQVINENSKPPVRNVTSSIFDRKTRELVVSVGGSPNFWPLDKKWIAENPQCHFKVLLICIEDLDYTFHKPLISLEIEDEEILDKVETNSVPRCIIMRWVITKQGNDLIGSDKIYYVPSDKCTLQEANQSKFVNYSPPSCAIQVIFRYEIIE